MNIDRTLRIGKKAENFIKNSFEKFDVKCYDSEEGEIKHKHNIDARHDMYIKRNNEKVRIEVKYDIMAEKTGNIAIETWNTKINKPSGLKSTIADIWAVVIPDGPNLTFWLISVKKLKDFVRNTPPKRIIENAGDDNAKIFLYDDYKILKEFTRMDDVTEKRTFNKRLKEIIDD